MSSALRRQRPDGSWCYAGGSRALRSQTDHDQLATFEALLALVEKHRLDVRHSAIHRAAGFLLGFQSDEGDLRGTAAIYSANDTAAILALLLDAGVAAGDARIPSGMRWLLSIAPARWRLGDPVPHALDARHEQCQARHAAGRAALSPTDPSPPRT